MHLRRALLLFALVLGLTALAASIAPAPRTDESTTPAATPPPPPSEPPPGEQAVSFRAPPPASRPPERKVAPGAELSVEVTAKGPGQAQIPALGRFASVTPAAPARFDLLAPSPGRYDVMFVPVNGEPQRVGTIVSRG